MKTKTEKKKNPAAVALGRLGGRVKGPCKARPSHVARAAALARWAKHRKSIRSKLTPKDQPK